ncbi:MAG: PilW family protein [Burkholderiales bacterium]
MKPVILRGFKLRSRRQNGVTLIELMVAMTLALGIVAAVSYIYIQGKTGFVVQDNRSRLQENARLAYSVMSRDLLMGGYFGCVKPVADFNTDPPISTLRITAAQPLMTSDISWIELDGDQVNGTRFLDPGATVRGYDDGAGWQVPSSVSGARLSGTDTLVVLRGGEDSRHLSESATIDEFKVVSVMSGVTTNGRTPPMVISDCTRGELIKPTIKSGGLVFSVANTLNDNTANPDANRDKLRYASSYGTSAIVTTFEPVSFYIAPAKGKNGAMVPSLHRLVTQADSSVPANAGRWKTSGDVVVEGVERMQLQYFTAGATDGTSDGPYTASQVTAAGTWRSVVAVQVTLGFVSDDDSIRTASTTQTVGGSAVTDNKIRLTSSFTVSIRNTKF